MSNVNENAEMAQSDLTKIIDYSEKLQSMFSVNDNLEDWVKAKLNHACDYVATVRDYLKFYRDEKTAGTPEGEINEKWSNDYKKRINCKNPRGFSQRAHCHARKLRKAGKHTKSKPVREVYDVIVRRMLKEFNSSMAMGALKQLNNDAKELQSMLQPNSQLEDWVKSKLNLAGEYLDDVYHHLDHFGSEGRKLDEDLNELDYEGGVGIHELMAFYAKATPDECNQLESCMKDQNVQCVKNLVTQVTGMTMNQIKEGFYQGSKNYWISPSGKMINIDDLKFPESDHATWAVLNVLAEADPDFSEAKGKNADWVYKKYSGQTSVYNVMLGYGYIRCIVMTLEKAIYLDFADETQNFRRYLTRTQASAVIKFAIEKEMKVVVDHIGKVLYEPPKPDEMNESWKTALNKAALATALLTSPNVSAAGAKKPATTAVKPLSGKIFVAPDKIHVSTPIQSYVLKNEGAVRNLYYIGSKPHIGAGHHLDGSTPSRSHIASLVGMNTENPQSDAKLKKYADGADVKSSIDDTVQLSDKQIAKLFELDFEDKKKIAEKRHPNFRKLPSLVQTMVIDSIFRGEKHPKTDAMINSQNPDWKAVADAYLDDAEYRQGGGVAKRMQRNADLLKRAAEKSMSIAAKENVDV